MVHKQESRPARGKRKWIAGLVAALALGGLTVPVQAADTPELVNVASQTSEHEPEVTVSYVPAWNSAGALNNGSSAAPGHGDVWGTYGDFSASHWAQYEWDTPVTVSTTSVWFWNDAASAGNVLNPQDWTFQYWDEEAEEFVDVVAEYPVATGDGSVLGPNTVAFDPVKTTKVRIVLNAQARDDSWFSVAATEWEVMGAFTEEEPEPVDPSAPIDVEAVHVRTAVNQQPILPNNVWVLPENGPLSYSKVEWASVDSASLAETGKFTVAGTLANGTTKVKATIYVVADPDLDVESFDYAATITTPGVAPVCPNTVVAHYADGSQSSQIGVTWEKADPSTYAEAESFGDISGSISGAEEPALCTFWVVEPAVAVDTPPYVKVDMADSPTATGWYTQRPAFTIIAQERTSPIASVEYSFGGDWTKASADAVQIPGEGLVTVYVRATDTEGRVGNAEAQLKVDTKAPSSTFTVTDDSEGKVVTVDLAAFDGEVGSGVSRIVYSMGPSADPESTENDMWATYDEPFTVARRDVPMYVHVRAQDVAGNQEQTNSITVDALKPTEPKEDPRPVPEKSKGTNAFFQDTVKDSIARTAMTVATATDVLAGDWDGDGVDTLVLRKGNVYTFLGSNRTGAERTAVTFGTTTSIPVVGDFNGDGLDDLAVRAARNNNFSISYNHGGAIPGGSPDKVITFGRPSDVPIAGDWDGDGTDSLGVQRGRHFLLRKTVSSGAANISFAYGRPGDTPIVGDFDGDGKDAISIVRVTTLHVNNSLRAGAAENRVVYGRVGDIRVAGDWFGKGFDSVAAIRY